MFCLLCLCSFACSSDSGDLSSSGDLLGDFDLSLEGFFLDPFPSSEADCSLPWPFFLPPDFSFFSAFFNSFKRSSSNNRSCSSFQAYIKLASRLLIILFYYENHDDSFDSVYSSGIWLRISTRQFAMHPIYWGMYEWNCGIMSPRKHA